MDRLQAWRAGLPGAEGLGAVAAAGLLGPEAEPSWSARELSYELYERIRKSGGILRWTFRERILLFDAWTLAQAWLLVRESGVPKPVSFEIDTPSLLEAGIHPFPLHIALRKALRDWDAGEREPPTKGSLSFDGGPDEAKGMGSYSVREIEPPEEEPPARYLQARMAPPVRPSFQYRVFVRIGLPDHRYASVEKPFPSLSETETHDLTVLFWEPTVSPEPQIQRLRLPPQGNSSEVRFAFPAAGGLKAISARITILHNNRVLQTGLLRASFSDGLSWTFELDATPRTHLEGLGSRTLFDAALVFDPEQGLTAAADGHAVVLDVDHADIQKLTRLLGRKISGIADDPARYKKLESPGSVELLRELAQKGARVHHHLCTYAGLSDLSGARRIHITSARAGSFFPAELLYVHRPPSDEARLCPHAAKALKAGDCTGDCPADKEQTICPLGFWGLSKVIERHAHRPEDRKGGEIELRSEPARGRSLLPISGTALLAASSKVSEVKKDAVTRLLEKLQERGEAVLATTWKDWTKHIQSKRPRLLVLLPHHDRDEDDNEFLEIGGDPMKTDRIWDEQVRLPTGPEPVVLLMGCETNLAEISFENPAIVFKSHGAAVVVTTIATILGRHASPATEALIQLLDRMADGKHTFGDIMLRLRQKLVATSTPMALGLTSYGDADWILTREKR